MRYSDKFTKIKPFVKLKIPHNKINFTKSEKSLISRYYNKLESMGYFNREQEGYILKDISRSKYKIKNAPKLKSTFVNVGTNIINGKIVTDKSAKIKIKNGKIYVKRQGLPYKWEFEYNIKKDWKLNDFIKHLLKKMLPNKPKKGQIYMIGAGIYEMRGTADTDIEELAKEILKLSNKYTSMVIEGEREENQAPEYFMYRIIVYESQEAFKLRGKNQKKRKKKKENKIMVEIKLL